MRVIALAILLGLLGCNQSPPPPPPPPPPPACQSVTPIQVPAEQVTLVPLTTLKVLDPTLIDEVNATQLVVNDGTYEAGQLLLSNCNDGLLRKIKGVSESSQGVGSQGIKKIFIQTEATSLEEAIQQGEASFKFGDLPLEPETTIQAMSGVQALGGKVTFKNVTWTPQPGVTVTLNGFLSQTLEPEFNFKIEGNSLKEFLAKLQGTLTSNLQASIVASKGVSLAPANSERVLATFVIRRAFLLGSVPVVVVIEPRVIAGVEANLGGGLNVAAGIAPTLTLAAGVQYKNSKWGLVWQPPAFTLNPTFTYSAPAGSDARIYSRIDFGLKFYGLGGPKIATEPYLSLALEAAPAKGTLRAGLSSTMGVQAGFTVLGKALELAYDGPAQDVGKEFNCTTSACSAK